MKLFTGIITLLVGIMISCVAGYFSIVGLAALFAAAGISIILMGASLEIGKLVAASWLKMNWADKSISIIHKGYLLVAIASLMAITSIGIYGFLAAGHLEQKAPLEGLNIESQQYEIQLTQKNNENDRLMKRLDQIDNNISSFITQGKASRGLEASNVLKKERGQIALQIEENNKIINDLHAKLAPIKSKSSLVEAKLGPVKYLSQLFGYENSPEVAVQVVILMIMIPFDPLAVVLVLSGMISINQWREERKKVTIPENESDEPEPESAFEPIFEQDQEQVTEPEIESDDETIIEIKPELELVPEPEAETIIESEPAPEPVITPKLSQEDLLDLLEENPNIVADLVEVIKDMDKKTPTDLTGGRAD